MGRNYGVILPEHERRRIVDTWRATNPWARSFWDELWSAVIAAYKNPGVWHRAGRVHYAYAPSLMRGTLICQLPDERWLVYPQFKHERVVEIVVDDDGTEREVIRTRTSYVKGFGGGAARVELWYGVCCENVTQAIAASILRRALDNCEREGLEVVLHTHDEIVVECDIADEQRVRELLADVMLDLPDWGDGIPLAVDIESGPYYTK